MKTNYNYISYPPQISDAQRPVTEGLLHILGHIRSCQPCHFSLAVGFILLDGQSYFCLNWLRESFGQNGRYFDTFLHFGCRYIFVIASIDGAYTVMLSLTHDTTVILGFCFF